MFKQCFLCSFLALLLHRLTLIAKLKVQIELAKSIFAKHLDQFSSSDGMACHLVEQTRKVSDQF